MGSNYPRWFINHHCTRQDDTDGLRIYVPKTSEIFNDSVKKIRKVSIGKKNSDCPEKVVLLVGETFSGKSTLINAMFNYIVGVKREDNFRLKLVDEELSSGYAAGQTRYITVYVIYHNSHSNAPFTMTIIDTPGLGNTAGIERDEQIADQMRTFFKARGQNGIDKIDAIGLVTLACVARWTPSRSYIFEYILSLFGKDIANNTIILATFADYQKPSVLDPIRESRIPYKKYFKFNNSALYVSNKDGVKMYDSDDESEDESEDCNFDEMSWNMGIKSFKAFMIELEKLQENNLKQTEEVCDKTICLQTTTQKLETNIDIGHTIIHRLATNLETDTKYEYRTGEVDGLVQKDVNEFGATYMQILALTEDTRKTMQTLKLIALRMNPLLTLDYINILMRAERMESKPGWKERLQLLEGKLNKAILMKEIYYKIFDPFLKASKENRRGVWTKVVKYLKPRFGNGFYIDMESYRSAAHETWKELSAKSQTSSNPVSTTNLHAKAGQNAAAACSDQNVSLIILALYFF